MPAEIRKLLHLLPVPVALVDPDADVQMNTACRTLLGTAFSGSETAAARWLSAAVERLHADARTRETLTLRNAEESLDLTLQVTPWTEDPWPCLISLESAGAVIRSADTDLVDTVSTLCHELRTPLTSIKTSLKLVTEGETGPLNKDQRHFLNMSLRNIDRLDRLVGDLLDSSRGDAGRLVIRHRKLDLMPTLRECLDLQAAAAQQADITFETEALPTEFMAEVDTDKVVRMVSNVVSNAIKYTPAGGLVRVWLEKAPDAQGQMFALVIEDNGPGMGQSTQARLFDPYRRGHDEQACDIPGSGLGLHITRGLVEAHGGQLSLFSAPGRGTTVWIRLPRYKSAGLVLDPQLPSGQKFPTGEVPAAGPMMI